MSYILHYTLSPIGLLSECVNIYTNTLNNISRSVLFSQCL